MPACADFKATASDPHVAFPLAEKVEECRLQRRHGVDGYAQVESLQAATPYIAIGECVARLLQDAQIIADRLTEVGHRIVARQIVIDSETAIRSQLAAWIADSGVDVVIATGGTGVTPRDVTPEALAPLITKPIPGFGELFRWVSFEEIGTSTIQSRAEAALCDQTYVFLLPGSPGGVRTALEPERGGRCFFQRSKARGGH